jgi:hypothetical protein
MCRHPCSETQEIKTEPTDTEKLTRATAKGGAAEINGASPRPIDLEKRFIYQFVRSIPYLKRTCPSG